MAIKILRPEEIASAGLARLGIYAENGVGKTTFLSSIPQSVKTLVVSADQENIKPLVSLPHIRAVKISQWDDLDDIYRVLASDKNPFQCVAFDTWTRMQGLALNKVARGNFNIEQAGNFLKSPPPMGKGYDVWEKVGALAGDGMRMFLALPVHAVFLFQEDTRNLGKLEDLIQTGPALTPAALRVAREALEIVGRMYVVDEGKEAGEVDLTSGDDIRAINPNRVDKRMLLIGKHDRFFSKGPTHKLGYVVENPTWEKLSTAWSIPAA